MKNIKMKKIKTRRKNIPKFLKEKIEYYRKIIIKTILIVQKYKGLDILGASELNVCIKNFLISRMDIRSFFEGTMHSTRQL